MTIRYGKRPAFLTRVAFLLAFILALGQMGLAGPTGPAEVASAG